ncbi:MAG: ABC transporter permease subunit [Bacilli bacterium]
MKHAFNIVRKELDKIFRNPRLIFSTFILPGLLIFVIYSLLGTTLKTQVQKANEHISIIKVINCPESFLAARDLYLSLQENDESYLKLNAEIDEFDLSQKDESTELKDYAARLVEEGQIDALIEFEDDFDDKIETFLEAFLNKEQATAPKITIYTDTTINNSSVALSKINVLLGLMNSTKMAEIGNPQSIYSNETVELASEEETSGQMIGMLLPMLITIFVFAGGMSVGADAIAGEKERGTISTLLMAPISKSYIVVGKIISTIIITVLSSLGSFIGVIASFPNAKELFGEVGMISFGFVQYLQIFTVILLIALISTSFFLIASTIAKSTKEATMYATPVYMIAMVTSYIPIFTDKLPKEIGSYLIPIYNLILGIKGILLSDLKTLHFVAIVGSTLVYAILLLSLVRVLFKSEKLMFQK